MKNINRLIPRNLPHITTNTLIYIAIVIIALYLVPRIIVGAIKLILIVFACWFVLMAFQSTNIINIPVVRQFSTSVEKVIPYKTLWTHSRRYRYYYKKWNQWHLSTLQVYFSNGTNNFDWLYTWMTSMIKPTDEEFKTCNFKISEFLKHVL